MTKLIPLENHVIVEPMVQETTTASGIILPDAKEKPEQGKVLAVWPGKTLENWQKATIDLQEGDMVYFTKYAPDEIEFEGKKYLIIQDKSILCKVG